MITFIILVICYLVFRQNIHDIQKRLSALEGQVISGTPVVQPVTTPVLSPVPVKKETIRTEDVGSVLAKVGVAILVLGVGFFLNYINSKGLLSYSVKFTLGLISGGVMIGLAEYLKEKTYMYAQILRGGGFIVWFLSIFIGSMVYALFSILTALMLTAGVSILSFLVSVKEKKETTFLIGILGAYLVPLIATSYIHDVMSIVSVLWYVSVINIGIVLAAKSMNWIRSIGIGFFFSWVTLFLLYGDMGAIGWKIQLLFVTIYALTYLIVCIIRDIQQSKTEKHVTFSVVLGVLNTTIYSIVAYDIVYKTMLDAYIGFLIAALAIVHFIVYLIIRNETQQTNHPSALAHLVLAVALLTASVPMQFDGAIVTMIWFIEGVILSYLASTKDFKGTYTMYVLGLVSMVAGIIHMGAFGQYTGVRDGSTIVLNQKYLVWLFAIILIHGIAYIWKSSASDDSLGHSFRKHIVNASILLVLLGQVSFVLLTVAEIQDLKYVTLDKIYEAREKQLAESNAYFEYDVLYVRTAEQQKYIDDIYTKAQYSIDESNKNFNFIYIIFFTIMTVMYLMIGLLKNNNMIRILGIISLVITMIQLFVLAWSLGPVYRIASFVGLGIILLVIAYIYMRHNAKKVISTMVLCMALLCTTQIHASVIDSSAWSHVGTFSTQDIVRYDPSWYVAPIAASVWNASTLSDKGDIRIINTKQEEIPYIIVKQGVNAPVQSPLPVIRSQTKILENTIQSYNGASRRVIVIDTGKEGQVYTGISFLKASSSQNFRKVVRVYISDTLLGASSPAWREVEQKDVVYNYVAPNGLVVEDMNIHFPNMTSRYIKLRFEDDEVLKEKGVSFKNQVQITGVHMLYEQEPVPVGAQIKNYISGDFDFSNISSNTNSETTTYTIERTEEGIDKKTTELYLKNVYAVTSMTLHVPAKYLDFNRDVVIQGSKDAISWQTVAIDRIYRIASPIYTGESLKIKTPVITYPYVRIIIQNKNDTALQFDASVDVTTQKIAILFKTEDPDIQSLRFLIGNSHAITPTYDIQKTLAYVGSHTPSQTHIVSFEHNPSFIGDSVKKPFGETYKHLIQVVLIVFVAVLGYLGYTWTKKA